MRYRLIALTHGDHATLADTIEAFAAMVSPVPTDKVLVCDGMPEPCPSPYFSPAETVFTNGPLGFCETTELAWSIFGAEIGLDRGWAGCPWVDVDYVFWLEHDHIVMEPVDLCDLAFVLDTTEESLAQMALMRDAVNEQEKAAGGLFESRAGQYEARVAESPDGRSLEWYSHRSYYTTNANLMRQDFMRQNPWPDRIAEHCEGHFGVELANAGWTFGVWGDGHPMTRHIGRRTGFGY